ncbi:hypothetical protein [Mycoplasmopsis bovirhinis]|uniref:hypothetical protein n=1 Tax=Mycoplasmopsis bovirhinis TaxID=29553 RepID=UPI0012FD6E1C|nr:hypothetical protein [Mycoplasmopsis bovirhinis]
MPKYKNLVKLATFIPPIWLDNNGRIKQNYSQNQSGGFNTVYFDENLPKIKEKFIEISSKELFNSLIINRFKELHNHDEFNDDIQIKELFESIYLDNKDVYNLFKNNNIYIFANYGNITQHNSTIDYLVPFYEHDKITLNIIVNDQNRRRKDVVPQSHSFGVFVLPKSKELKFEILEDTRTTNDNLAYYKTLYNWYNNSYLKVYKDK